MDRGDGSRLGKGETGHVVLAAGKREAGRGRRTECVWNAKNNEWAEACGKFCTNWGLVSGARWSSTPKTRLAGTIQEYRGGKAGRL